MANGHIAYRNKSVSQSHFAMIPRADIPRSRFSVEFTHKTTFEAGRLIPIYVEEVLPGDSFNVSMTGFARMSTPLFPIMDNLHMDTFFFFVPNRLVWPKWPRMMGEQTSPGASTDFTVPQRTFTGVPQTCSVYDYMGIPGVSQVTNAAGLSVNALPIRGYKLIWNEWFRDQNLQAPQAIYSVEDGPDTGDGQFVPYKRGKRHDYFTSALPWPQKGGDVSLPLGTLAPISGLGVSGGAGPQAYGTTPIKDMADGQVAGWPWAWKSDEVGDHFFMRADGGSVGAMPDVYADLSQATAASINAIRQAFQVQRLLERDARGGTRYTELLLSHFGVSPQDSRLQRPEYLGGGSSPVHVSPIAQQSATGLTGGATPLGSLGAVATGMARHGFSGSFTEHGFIIGLLNVRSDLTYQQGLHRMWSRETRYDYYWPVFAHLGEQAILRKEIFMNGITSQDELVFGYQERWAEYRYHPSMITGRFRSTATSNLDEWHLSQQFLGAPLLSDTFIQEDPPMSRILAAGGLGADQQFLFDSVFSIRFTRAMPTYSVPGFIDRF